MADPILDYRRDEYQAGRRLTRAASPGPICITEWGGCVLVPLLALVLAAALGLLTCAVAGGLR